MKEALMPLYTCITQEGTLSAEQRATIATEITRIHTTRTGAGASFVRVIFQTLSPESTFAGGKPAVNAFLLGIIRASRSTEVKAQLLNELWSMYKKATGLTDDQLFVTVIDVPASNGMEMGAILPEPGEEAEWLAKLGLTKEEA
jgi:phenylpyruvate tautomerase PptA (4-oxalocrotonate tautomerase family)